MATQRPDAQLLRELENELKRSLDRMGAELTRVRILADALAGFSQPVPDYEPTFHHLNHSALPNHELGH